MRLENVTIFERDDNYLDSLSASRREEWSFTKSLAATGIRKIQRTDLSVVDMALEAYHKLTQDDRKYDVCIFVTQSHSSIIPPPSSEFLGRANILCPFAIDLNSGCSGYVYALSLLADMFTAKRINRGMIITAEKYSRYLDKNDRATNMIFSDGCAISTFERGSAIVKHYSFGNLYETHPSLRVDINQGYIDVYKMHGPKVFEYATNIARKLFEDLPNEYKRGDAIDYYLYHQASKLVLDRISSDLGIDRNKFLTNYVERGNTTSSTIPYLIHDNWSKLKSAKLFYLSGFGVGLSHGAMLIESLL
jgi:3-oxoacyl-[acyl-carrier-protein] synthase-3